MPTQYTSPYNLPYPQIGDPVKEGAAAIEGIAKGVNTALQNGSFPSSNPDVASITARLNALESTFVDVNKTDTNWSYAGGMWVTPAAGGFRRVNLTLKLTRTGGAFTSTTTAVQAIDLIPAAYRPNGYALRRGTVMMNSVGDDVWGLYVYIKKDGKFFIATDGGSVSVGTGNIIELDFSWIATNP